MSTFTTLVIILGVLVACVTIITFIQKREQEKAAIRQKIAQYRYRANQATTILSNLVQLPIGQESRKVLLQYALGNLVAISRLSPNDPVNSKNIQSIKLQAENPKSPADKQKLVIPHDPMLLKQQIAHLTNLAKFIMKLGKSPAVTSALVPVAVQKIMALISESKICAYIQQGKDSLSKHDYVPAQRNFTMAQQMLAKVPNKNNRLQQLEIELQELIKSSPTEAMNTQLSFNEEEVHPVEGEEKGEGQHDELFGPKKKW